MEVSDGRPLDAGSGISEGQGREGRLVYSRVKRLPVGDCGGHDWRSLGRLWAVGRGRPLDGGEGGKGRGKGVQQYPTMTTYS
jgi:hypothetical protein